MFMFFGFASTVSLANPITPEEALQNVVKFLNAQPSEMKKVKGEYKTEKLTLVYTRKNQGEQNLFYVFNRAENNGYVIASADDCAESVLGYSEQGKFLPDQLPCNMRWFLDSYAHQIEYAKQHGLQVKAIQKAKRKTVKPLLETTWNQYEPYNNFCPIDTETGERSIVGCVAVAQAQVMFYHRWPERGIGSHSYEWRGKKLSANFGNTVYQWDKMKYNYERNDSDPNNAIATLMYHCGISLEMNYNSYGSYASISGEELFKYFGYADSYQFMWREDDPDAFEEALYDNISRDLPVLWGGQDLEIDEGHLFVCDGYKASNGTYHINWGWGGYNDGYFKITYLQADDDRNYTEDQFIITEIMPKTATSVDLETDFKSQETGRYSINGYRLLSPKSGINIIKMDDGTVKKEFVR